MLNRYEVVIQPYGTGAKNKGIVTGSVLPDMTRGRWLNIPHYQRPELVMVHAPDKAAAFNLLCRVWKPGDNRPLAGKSYMPKPTPVIEDCQAV